MLLALETATDVCSVALLEASGSLLATAEVLTARAHAALLVPLVRDVLARADRSASDLEGVAVSAGPGSFTGLRIGVSTAKGLCFTTGAALVAVPTLEALALGARDALRPGEALLAALPSRRGEVYAAAFRRSAERLEEAAAPAALSLDALPDWLPEADAWFAAGPGAPAAREALGERLRILDPHRFRPRAEAVAALGLERLRAGAVEDLDAFEPAYLKAFEIKTGRGVFDRVPKK